MAQGMSRHRAARAPIGGVALLVVAGAAAVLLVGGSRSIEEVDECLELRRTIETCFGARAASHLRAKASSQGRHDLRQRCAADRDRIRRSCAGTARRAED